MADDHGFVTTRPTERYGDAYGTVTQGFAIAERWQCPGTGTVEISEIGYYGYSNGTSTIKFGIFTDDGNSPETLVANSEVDYFSVPGSAGVIYQTYATKPQLTGGDYYWIAIQGYGNNSYASRLASAGTSGYRTESDGTWPNAAEWDAFNTSTYGYSFFAVLVAATAQFARPSSDVAGGTFRSILVTAPFGPRVIA